MLIVAVDVETTGLDKEKDQVVELGAILYDTELERVISSFGKIYKAEVWGEEAALCHQIPKETSDSMPLVGSEQFDPWEVISGDMAKYVVAHNARHDYAFVTKVWPSFKRRPWLCTKEGIPHKEKVMLGRVASTRLGHLCVDYHITMGSWHQAVADAEACARLASKHDLDAAYERKIALKYRLVTYGEYLPDIRDVMGNAPSVLRDGKRYRWNQEEAPRAWMKDDLTLEEVEEDAKYLKEITKGKWKFEGEPLPPKPY
jgi:DNA polymerase III epsilon subunit-like protein